MDNTNKHFKGQHKDEIIVCFTRRHWVTILPEIMGFLIFIVLISVFFVFVSEAALQNAFDEEVYEFFAGLAILVCTIYLHRFFLHLINYYMSMLVITNIRILDLKRTLYFHRMSDGINITEIQDVVSQQDGVIKNIFNYGEVVVRLSSVDSLKMFTYIPNPEYYFRKIQTAKTGHMHENDMPNTA